MPNGSGTDSGNLARVKTKWTATSGLRRYGDEKACAAGKKNRRVDDTASSAISRISQTKHFVLPSLVRAMTHAQETFAQMLGENEEKH